MSRMIDDEEELKDYGLIEKCSNLVTDENKCLDTWDDENADYKKCKEINCYFKQLQRAKADIEELKESNDSYDKAVRALLSEKDKLQAEKQGLINYFELKECGMQEDIQYWKNKAQEFYKELEEYKKSKQASYEAMQIEWNKAVNELRDVKAENEKLKAELDKYKRID